MILRPGFWRALFAVAWKDLSLEWRSRQALLSMLVFAILVVLLFNFALEMNANLRAELVSGILWTALTFTGTLGLARSFNLERENGCLDGLLLVPSDRAAILLGKALANWLIMLIVAGLLLPVFTLVYNQNLFHLEIILILCLGCLGYAVIGSLLSAMASQARTRDMLLPVLLFPLVIPLLVAGVKACGGILAGDPLSSQLVWLEFLIVYDVVFTTAVYLTAEAVLEE